MRSRSGGGGSAYANDSTYVVPLGNYGSDPNSAMAAAGGGISFPLLNSANARAVWTFTAPRTCSLARFILISQASGGTPVYNFELGITDALGVPLTTLVAAQTIAPEAAGTARALRFAFPTPPSISYGQRYALIAKNPSPDPVTHYWQPWMSTAHRAPGVSAYTVDDVTASGTWDRRIDYGGFPAIAFLTTDGYLFGNPMGYLASNVGTTQASTQTLVSSGGSAVRRSGFLRRVFKPARVYGVTVKIIGFGTPASAGLLRMEVYEKTTTGLTGQTLVLKAISSNTIDSTKLSTPGTAFYAQFQFSGGFMENPLSTGYREYVYVLAPAAAGQGTDGIGWYPIVHNGGNANYLVAGTVNTVVTTGWSAAGTENVWPTDGMSFTYAGIPVLGDVLTPVTLTNVSHPLIGFNAEYA